MQQVMMSSAQDVYRKRAIMTASPAELIVMLYEALKKNMLMAGRAIDKHDAPAAHEKLIKSQAIVNELISSLDMRVVPLSENLLSVYEYMLYAMEETNLKKDKALIAPVVEMIDDLKSAWETVSEMQHGSLALGEA
jgi:flagellar protein FliS